MVCFLHSNLYAVVIFVNMLVGHGKQKTPRRIFLLSPQEVSGMLCDKALALFAARFESSGAGAVNGRLRPGRQSLAKEIKPP
jgi:hypothetical protein